MNQVHSPLDPTGKKAELIDEFESERVINQYKKIGLEVSRFFKNPKFYLYQCVTTGYRFYYPENIIADAKFYEDISISRTYYSKRWEHERALKFLKRKDSVLEIGSGFGIFLSMLKEKGIKGKGLELNVYAVEKCMQLGLEVNSNLIQEEAMSAGKRHDVVVTFQVLEHIYDVNEFLYSTISVLKSGGRLIIGVPNNNPYIFIGDKFHTLNLPPHHAGLWNKNSLKSLEKIFPIKLENIEFEPLELTYDYFINFHIANSNIYLRVVINFFKRKFPGLLKLIICKFFKGRNILAVYRKL